MTKLLARQTRHRRIRSRMRGTAVKPRVVVYRSLAATYVQAIDDTAGKVIAQSSDLKAKNGKPTERARTIGTTLGKALTAKGVTVIAFDRAGYQYHGRVKAVAEGLRESGLAF